MSKVYGIIKNFVPVVKTKTRFVYSFCKEDIDDTHATWYEVVFYKKINPNPSIEQIKEKFFSEINKETDNKILSEFVWNDIPVWLSSESQFNFKAAYDLAVQTQGQSLPVKFKLGEDAENNPIYHTFETLEDISDFFVSAISYINQCLNKGWEKKDSVDWSLYEQ